MIRFEQRNFDLQGTEKVFKKVVHSGQNAIRLVDKDGVPLRTPNNLTFSRLHSTYTLTPRGVPTRKSNHAYSGQPAQAKMQTLVNSLDTSSQEMDSYNALNGYGKRLNSAGSSRQYQSTAGSSKKKANDPSRSVKSFDKSATRERTRLLVSAPSAEQMIDPNGEKSNESPQGKRLEKEWSALSQCRALKRSSEIVSHRVDRMYFMTGNKLRLQAKYQVDDGDIQQLRELQHARDSARSTRDELTEQARYLMKRREVDENNATLVKIEQKLSRIEHRLGFIEEQNNEIQNEIRANSRDVKMEVRSISSSESGIEEHEMEETDVDEHVTLHRLNNLMETEPLPTEKRSVSRIEIRGKSGHGEDSNGIQVWDILSHDRNTTGAETMIKLFELYPNVHIRARQNPERNEFETANALTLGVPRKVRHEKLKSHKAKLNPVLNDKAVICNAITPTCCLCKCQDVKVKTKKNAVHLGGDSRKERLGASFPTRKPSIRVLPHPPVECECRPDVKMRKRTGPLLTVTGTQVPLCDREVLHS
ncbi:uncharacterized protein LOC127844731 isoform X1 [Dreissena polymorpha]|uniref:uncharacterized protein LOC127844731 isoform X1 n=1 Tax=Dreissena polymorpha TaxID=45954 RepID=UPI0022642271|nr:uncharacterized protein LOC127844731 isoform X1 [Dreissena polymorpha]